jgi:hypothetical protein
MGYDISKQEPIFMRLGTYIHWWYKLDQWQGELDTRLDDALGDFLETSDKWPEDKQAYEAFSIEIRRQKEELESMQQSIVNLVSDFFGLNVKAMIESAYSSTDDVIDDLIDQMEDYAPSYEAGDRVLQNIVSVDQTVTEDEDNSFLAGDYPGDFSLNFGTDATQMAQDDHFVLTCADDSVVDGERWTLDSARLGQYSGEVVTDQSTDWYEAGIEKLNINPAPVREVQDSDKKVDKWTLSGAVRGTNIDEDGYVWLRFKNTGSGDPVEENDELDQVTGFDFATGTNKAVFGKESDIDGSLHVSVVKEPSSVIILGGTYAELSESDTIIDNADNETTDGRLYAEVERAEGSISGTSKYTVTLYKESSRSTPVASGVKDNVPDENWPSVGVEINLEPEPGHNLVGQVTLTAFNSTEDETDDTIVIKVPRYFVRVYRSESRSEDDLVSEGVSYDPTTTSLALNPKGEFETKGTVTLRYVEDNEEIIVSNVFDTIDMCRSNPNGGDFSEDDIVARAGSTATLCGSESYQSGAAEVLTFYEVNASGLTSASIEVDLDVYVGDGYVASARAGFSDNDKFTFSSCQTGVEGRFQTFLRDNFGKVFAGVESDPEIFESWAGG